MPTPKKTDEELHPENYFTSPVGHIRDRIIINESPEIPKEGLFLSLNGFAILAKPGVPIDIPRPMRLVLDNRITTETTQDHEGKDHRRHMKRITYQLIKEGVNIPGPEVISKQAESSEEKISF